MNRIQSLLTKAKTFPSTSGCYLMKNKEGTILYVGKAKNLKHRASSYFQPAQQVTASSKTTFLVRKIEDIEFFSTKTEAEALVLENNLIKKFSPKYNIQCRDDKTYPYVMVNIKEPFPRLQYVRRPQRDKDHLVFGPFVSGSHLSHILRILTKSFRLRDCSLKEFLSRKEPCILYQMNQCSAPCVEKISVEDYQKDLQRALDIFKGKGNSSLKYLQSKMKQYSQQENFEQALILRDQITELENFIQQYLQKHSEISRQEDLDIVGTFVGKTEVDVAIYLIRGGVLLGKKDFHFPLAECVQSVEEEILSFLLQYYTTAIEILPKKIILSNSKKELEVFSSALKAFFLQEKVEVLGYSKKYHSFLKLVQTHAQDMQKQRLLFQRSELVALATLQKILNLEERPRVLECFDIAVWQGKSPTASQVVFKEGHPSLKDYRYYHLQERPEGNNDFAMLEELIQRRLKKKNYPDVWIVDGGRQQVNSVKKVLQQEDVHIPVVGIAKERERTEERLFLPGRKNPFLLKNTPELWHVLGFLRDEAHRFCRKLHHKKEKERLLGKKN